MNSKTISATDAARNFSEILNQVKYQSAHYDVTRGRDIVARIVPATPASGFPVTGLNQLFANLPKLPVEDAAAFENDIKIARKRLGKPRDPWAS